jgi:hypothetical protein
MSDTTRFAIDLVIAMALAMGPLFIGAWLIGG